MDTAHTSGDGLLMYDGQGGTAPYVAPSYVLREVGWRPITDSNGVVVAHGQSLDSPVPRVMVQRGTDALRRLFQRVVRRIVV